MRSKYYYFLLRLVPAMAIVVAVWLPQFLYYQLDRSPVGQATAQALVQTPSNGVLDEVASLSVGVKVGVVDDEILATSNSLLTGVLPASGNLAAPLVLQGYPHDYLQGPPSFQLAMASLGVEDVLLSAYAQTHDPRLLDLATKRVLSFAAHEAAQRQDTSFLWNDHAVAGRVAVLIKFWRHVRGSAGLSAASAREILSLVARSARLLAKPDHFTVRTNHGVAQNLALLQITAAFPALPEVEAWRTLAVERLGVQLPFYVSPEGFVLEHSAGYHFFGTELLAIGVRLVVLNGMVPSAALVSAADKSGKVLARLMRPDGTLPVFGNTSFGQSHGMPVAGSGGTAPLRYQPAPHPAPAVDNSLFPVAGYAVWWQADTSSRFSQTLMVWAKHDGHGHKHADEGAVLLWSDGVDWITQTGYWPYGAAQEDAAYSWGASNAPHQPGDAFAVTRSAQLLGTGRIGGVSFIEVERRGADGARYNRQLMQIEPDTWLVLDFASAVQKGTETIWTLPPALRMRPAPGAQGFVSSQADDGRQLVVSYASSGQAKLQIIRGSTQPFAGWVVVNGEPTQADALHVAVPAANSVSAYMFKVVASSSAVPQPIALEPGARADHWRLVIGTAEQAQNIRKSASAITLAGGLSARGLANPPLLVPVQPAPDTAAERAVIQTAYATAVSAYPPWRELSFYRQRLTYALVALALLAELGWFATRQVVGVGKRSCRAFHTGVVAWWVAVAVWVFGIYLP